MYKRQSYDDEQQRLSHEIQRMGAMSVAQLEAALDVIEMCIRDRSYALQNKMPYASMQNAAGNWVAPSAESFAAAAASADWANAKDFSLVITNAPGADAWPITATNFILVYKQPKDAAKQQATLDFFKWAYEQGQSQAQALDYGPLPAELVQQVEAYWATLKSVSYTHLDVYKRQPSASPC